MTAITERIPMHEIETEARQQVHFGRWVATVFTAIFVGFGWTIGAAWYGARHCGVAVRYGYRQGARIQRVPEQSKLLCTVKPRDWDCSEDGHIPMSKKVRNAGRLGGYVTVTWCAVCGKKLLQPDLRDWREDMPAWPTQAVWSVVKDIVLTFGGLVLIMAEVFFIRPVNTTVIITGLAMTGLGASFHLGPLMEGFIGRSSSEHSSQHGSSEHSSSQESSGDNHG